MRLPKVRVNSGILDDLRGRLPWYKDDWTQGFNCTAYSADLVCLSQLRCSNTVATPTLIALMIMHSPIKCFAICISEHLACLQDLGALNLHSFHLSHTCNCIW